MNFSSVAHFVGSEKFLFAFPQARLPRPGAITLSAGFAGWLNDFFQQVTWLRPRPLSYAGAFRTATLQGLDIIQQHPLMAFGIYLLVNLF